MLVQAHRSGAREIAAPHHPEAAAGRTMSAAMAGVIVGIVLLLMAWLSVFANTVTGREHPSDALFRLAVVSWFGVAVLDILAAWALGIVFRTVQPEISALAAWMRIAYAAVFLVAISFLSVHDKETFHHLWQNGLLLVGLHLVLVGWLVWESGWLPRWLGVLVVLAGVGYAFDAVLAMLVSDRPFEITLVTFVGEPLLAIWLLVRGWRTRGEG